VEEEEEEEEEEEDEEEGTPITAGGDLAFWRCWKE
jgi:hypothetical protein